MIGAIECLVSPKESRRESPLIRFFRRVSEVVAAVLDVLM